MLILQDHSKYTARRLCVEPYITHSTSGLLKNHQYHVPVYHILVWDQIELKSKTKSYLDQGPKSYLGPGPNEIWVWDQIEFGSWTKSYLGLDPN